MGKRAREIVCWEVDGHFSSAALAAKWVGCHPSSIHDACKRGTAVRGRHFYYADEPEPEDSFFRNRKLVAVVCAENGMRFPSMTDAAKWAGCSEAAVSKAAKTGTRAGGYHWEKSHI